MNMFVIVPIRNADRLYLADEIQAACTIIVSRIERAAPASSKKRYTHFGRGDDITRRRCRRGHCFDIGDDDVISACRMSSMGWYGSAFRPFRALPSGVKSRQAPGGGM